MRRLKRFAGAAALAVLVLCATASAGAYRVKIVLPPQWAHGGRGTITLSGVAPPKAPYTSSLVLYATKLNCLASGWAFLGRNAVGDEGYVLGAGVASRFTYRDRNVPSPRSGAHRFCAYLLTVTDHRTIARATATWK